MSEAMRAVARVPLISPSPLARYRPHPERLRVEDGFVLTVSDGPETDFNLVVVFSPVAPERVFAMAAVVIGAAYHVVVEGETAAPMEAALRARGWHLDEEEPALVLSPIPATMPPAPDGLTIHAVTTDVAFADFRRVRRTSSLYVPSLEAARDPAVALFVGYDAQGQPVASSRLACYGAVGEINGVVTVPEHRRRGFGTAMTWAAIAACAARGCTAITLSATAMGLPVYRRMGFLPACTYRTYLPPAREDAASPREDAGGQEPHQRQGTP